MFYLDIHAPDLVARSVLVMNAQPQSLSRTSQTTYTQTRNCQNIAHKTRRQTHGEVNKKKEITAINQQSTSRKCEPMHYKTKHPLRYTTSTPTTPIHPNHHRIQAITAIIAGMKPTENAAAPSVSSGPFVVSASSTDAVPM